MSIIYTSPYFFNKYTRQDDGTTNYEIDISAPQKRSLTKKEFNQVKKIINVLNARDILRGKVIIYDAGLVFYRWKADIDSEKPEYQTNVSYANTRSEEFNSFLNGILKSFEKPQIDMR